MYLMTATPTSMTLTTCLVLLGACVVFIAIARALLPPCPRCGSRNSTCFHDYDDGKWKIICNDCRRIHPD